MPAREEPPEIVLGEQYGAWLTIEEPPERDNGEAWKTKTLLWRCRCECGREEVLSARKLARAPHCPSCAKRERAERAAEKAAETDAARVLLSLAREGAREKRFQALLEVREEARKRREEIQKRRAHPLHGLWWSIKNRCKYDVHYVSRGITVCAEWEADFWAFATYMDTVLGPKPAGYSIDRVDNNCGYEPGNVRWATAQEQMRNTSVNIKVTINGRTKTFLEWVDELGVAEEDVQRVRHRLQVLGWAPETAFTAPLGARPYQSNRVYEKHKFLSTEQKEALVALKLTPQTVIQRLQRGWSLEDALSEPFGATVQKVVECGVCGEIGHTALAHPEYKRVSGRKPQDP